MIVYWDLAAAWNFALDYLLLLGTLHLAGQPIRRKRVALAAALGAAYSVAALAMPALVWVLLLGRLGGGMARLARGAVLSELPWGVFCAAMASAYVLLTVIFRASARHDAADFVTARVEYGGESAELRLLRDTGNTLCDPLTGESVPVIEKAAVLPLLKKGNGAAYMTFTALRVGTVGGGGTLRAFRCDALTVDGQELGARLIALTEEGFGGAYQGLWGKTEEERHDLETMVG